MPSLKSALPFALLFMGLLSGCVTNAATGKRQFNPLSRDSEIAIGEEALPQLTQEYGGAVTDPAINQYLTSIGMSLVNQTEGDYRSLPWKFTLLNSSVINAFALPGGKVFISRALAQEFSNEAEMAGVLGHEIGHVTAEHADRAIARAAGLQFGASLAGAFVGDSGLAQLVAAVVIDGTGKFAMKYDRAQENESDELGMRYMAQAGYDPRGMLRVMQILAEASEASGAPPEWLSTHPAPESRIKTIQERLNTPQYREILAQPSLIVNEAKFRRDFLDRLRNVPAPVKGK